MIFTTSVQQFVLNYTGTLILLFIFYILENGPVIIKNSISITTPQVSIFF